MMTEREFLSALQTLPLHPGARGLKDDCALIEIGGETLIFNHEMMAEDTHFRRDADLADVAWKLVAINLSDLASKGAEPVGVLLGHSLGGNDQRFIAGLREVLSEYSVPLMGGDTVAATGASTYSLTAIGRATRQPVPARTSAEPGQSLFVTGEVGGAMLGFEGASAHLTTFNRPRARIDEGIALAPHVGAMMDISDGLLLDVYRMAEASGVSIALDHAAIPVADEARRDECMRWGDDYELLFTLPGGKQPPAPATLIGTVEQRGYVPLFVDSHPVANSDGLGYQHG